MLEPFLGIISCSLPLLRPVGQRILALCGRADVLKSEHRQSEASVESKRTSHRVRDPYYLNTTVNGDSAPESEVDLRTLINDGRSSLVLDPERTRVD